MRPISHYLMTGAIRHYLMYEAHYLMHETHYQMHEAYYLKHEAYYLILYMRHIT